VGVADTAPASLALPASGRVRAWIHCSMPSMRRGNHNGDAGEGGIEIPGAGPIAVFVKNAAIDTLQTPFFFFS